MSGISDLDSGLSFAPEPEPPLQRAPTAAENATIASVRAAMPEPPAKVAVTRSSTGRNCVVAPHADVEGHRLVVQKAIGTASPDFAGATLRRLASLSSINGKSMPDEASINEALAMVQAAKPENELEAALAIEMAVSHQLALRMLDRASMHEYEPRSAFLYANAASKLMRSIAAQMTALSKLRRQTDQHITVEHLHVAPGAQAIVANSVMGGGREKRAVNPEEGMHEELAQHCSDMWRETQGREPVQLEPRAGQEAMPATRRRSR